MQYNILRHMGVFLVGILLLNACKSGQDKTTDLSNARIKALIVNGQMNNSHDDQQSSPMMEEMLEYTGIFNVEIASSPKKGSDMSAFQPNFADYDVVILDYDGDEWSETCKTAFVDYVKNGGGVVVVHSANNAFPDWIEFNEIIGLGGWNGRTEKHGPYVYWKDGEVIRDSTTPGPGGHHGAQTPVLVQTRAKDHPIMKGLPENWLHARDELYANLRGPAQNMEILATAYSDTTTNGSGKHEPALFTIRYGEGRIFHTVLGHVNGKGPHISMQCAGFITTLQRGTEWAATGEVLQEVPAEFPNYASWILWEKLRPLSLDELVEAIQDYETGDSREYLSALTLRIRKSDQKPETLKKYEDAMIQILKSNAGDDAKNMICRELGLWGTDRAVPTLETLKSDDGCAEMADYALQMIQR